MITSPTSRRRPSASPGACCARPTLPSDAVSRATGADVVLKLDNLQVTGAFKERGAANRLALLSEDERARGVIAMSAGNHAQAVARHAQSAGHRRHHRDAEIHPVHQGDPHRRLGRRRWCCTARPWPRPPRTPSNWRRNSQLVFVHPYDDPAVIAGQGTLALELLAGCAGPRRAGDPGGRRRPARRLPGRRDRAAARASRCIGVEVEAYAAMAQKPGRPRRCRSAAPTIAEGIAVRDIGEMPFEMVRRRVTDVLVVPERAVEEAIGLLVEGGKTVAEGAGAVGVAALLTYPERFRGKRVGVAITGGNIDARILSNVLLRDLLRDGRLLRLHLQIPDRPGVLADIAGKIGDSGGNIIEVSHQRLFAAVLRAGGGTGGDGGSARSGARRRDRRGAGGGLRGAAVDVVEPSSRSGRH